VPKPRYAQVSLEATPYYHCVSRCVRRAFLCGSDQLSGNSYEHRRQWIEDKLLKLAGVFAVDVCAYAIMSNHYHVVFFIDREKAENWSQEKVIHQWHQLFSGTLFSQRFLKGETLSQAEQRLLDKTVEEWRKRLMDISWFMRVLNEFIARQANFEDNYTGRFWEGRSSHKPYWMNQPWRRVWRMLTSTRFGPVWPIPPRPLTIPAFRNDSARHRRSHSPIIRNSKKNDC